MSAKPSSAGQSPSANGVSTDERRRAVRYPSNAETSCQPLDLQRKESWPARVRDISTTGIGLVVGRRFERGTFLTLGLQGSNGQSCTYMARVVHATLRAEGEWLVGCAFVSELDDDDLGEFQVERVRPRQDEDCRAWVRFPCEIGASCQTVPPAEPERFQVLVCDISPGGLGIFAPREFEAGTLLSLELPAEGKRPPRKLLVRVTRPSALAGGDWLLGCEFARQMTDDDLEALKQ